jgi:hypothetical protein
MRRAVTRWFTGWPPILMAAVLAVAAAFFFQVQGRGWLAWDEAARVEPGYRLVLIVQTHRWIDVWNWVNDQTFYPFLTSAIHGTLIWAGLDPLSAGWVPSLLAFGLAGVLASRVARAMGSGPVGGWVAAVLFWAAPIEIRLAAGAFTEPLGICLYLGLMLLLIRLSRGPDTRTLIAAGVLVAISSWIKWDYGIAAVLTVAAVAAGIRGARRRMVLVLSLGLAAIGALLAVNGQAKIAGLLDYTGQAVPGAAGHIDFLYYLGQLLPAANQVGLSLLTTVLLMAGASVGIWEWRRNPAVRPVVALLGVLYIMYSVATIKHPRYVATLIPVLAVLAGLAVGRAFQTWPRSRVSVQAVVLLMMLTIGLQGPAIGTRLPWLNPDDRAALDLARAVSATAAAPLQFGATCVLALDGGANPVSIGSIGITMRHSGEVVRQTQEACQMTMFSLPPGPVLLIHADNAVSPEAVRLLVELREHRMTPEIPTPPYRPRGPFTVVEARR